MQQEYIDCFDLFDYAENAVVLTGAGISTLSGIPDYRGKSGLDLKKEFFEGFARSEITDIKFFTKHPDIFYRYAKNIFTRCWIKLLRLAISHWQHCKNVA